MEVPLLIMDVQVFSLDMQDRFLTALEGILRDDDRIMIKIPTCTANPAHGGPIVGERYLVRFVNGIDPEGIFPELFYLGRFDHHLVFSTTLTPMQAAKTR